jgi:hypothetical protein
VITDEEARQGGRVIGAARISFIPLRMQAIAAATALRNGRGGGEGAGTVFAVITPD